MDTLCCSFSILYLRGSQQCDQTGGGNYADGGRTGVDRDIQEAILEIERKSLIVAVGIKWMDLEHIFLKIS